MLIVNMHLKGEEAISFESLNDCKAAKLATFLKGHAAQPATPPRLHINFFAAFIADDHFRCQLAGMDEEDSAHKPWETEYERTWLVYAA